MTKKSISLIVIFVFFFSICGCNKQNKIDYNLSYNQNEAFGYKKLEKGTQLYSNGLIKSLEELKRNVLNGTMMLIMKVRMGILVI